MRPDADIIDKLLDLHKQATTERSHNYVAACAKEAMTEILKLRFANEGMMEIIARLNPSERKRKKK